MSASQSRSKRPSEDISPGPSHIKVRRDYISMDNVVSAGEPSGSGMDLDRPPSLDTITSAQPPPAIVVARDDAPSPAARDPQIAQLFAMVNHLKSVLTAQADSRDDDAGPGDRELPEYGGVSDDERSMGDPLDQLPGSADIAAAQADATDFDKVLDGLAGFFDGQEETGDNLSVKLAECVGVSLRRRPNDARVKQVVSKLKFPANVPQLVVPSLNEDVRRALDSGGKVIEIGVFRCANLVAKALVPLLHMMDDIARGTVKPATSYLDGTEDSVRLLAAVFNILNHVRKDVARYHVQETALQSFCNWDCEVGMDKLFPFDVTKRCDEIRKVRKLGSSGTQNRQFFGRGGGSFYKYDDRYRSNDYKSDYKSDGGDRRGRSRTPYRPYSGPRASQGKGESDKSS